jgi:hypothetical protein
MNDQYTPKINSSNVNSIRHQIAQKTGDIPFHATGNYASQVITDYDNFPYNRWWRGVPDSEIPIIAEREAGVRRHKNQCYKIQTNQVTLTEQYPNHAFSTGNNVSFPSYPEYLTKYSDKALMETILNKACIPLKR